MIKSMTGFGKAEAKFGAGKITVELKTVNHKFFDATVKLPESLVVFEEKIKEALQAKVNRGKIYLNLIYDGAGSKYENIKINKNIAKRYYNELASLKRYLGLKDPIKIDEIIAMPGVVDYEAREKNLSALWPKIKLAVDKAVAKLTADREKEGRAIYADLMNRASKIETMLAQISTRSDLNINEYRKRFAERVKDFTSGTATIDRGRLEMEVAIFAKNSDITEEITRLKNHMAHFKKTIGSNGDVGKKLDFIAQELHREINTAGAKASDFKISKNVIDIKSEIEKIREQAKNIE